MTKRRALQDSLKAALPGLINRIRSGDLPAKEEFAVILLPFVTLLVNKYRHTIDDEVESVAGLVITKLLNGLDKINLEKSVLGYVVTTTNNYCIDRHRRTKRISKQYKPIEMIDKYTSIEDNNSTPEFLIDSHFCETDAEVLGMYYIKGMSLEEISIQTGSPIAELQETITLVEGRTLDP